MSEDNTRSNVPPPKPQLSWSTPQPTGVMGSRKPSYMGDGTSDVQNVTQLFPWYASTGGPGVSMTLFNLAGTFLPMLNLMLASSGINLLPGTVNLAITLAVFVYFAVRAAIGYVRAKRTLGARIVSLQATNKQLSSQLGHLQAMQEAAMAAQKRSGE